MTPAEVAEQLGQFISKQEETLSRYPVGPLGNTARRNLEKGRKALKALQGKNEAMRMQKQPNQGATPQMEPGGPTGSDVTRQLGLRNYNPGNLRKWGDREIVDGFAVFNTPQEGWDALQKQLDRYKQGKTPGTSGDMTLLEAMQKYAPKEDANNPDSYANSIADMIATAMYKADPSMEVAVGKNTPIKDIPTDLWASAVSRIESPQMYAALVQQNLIPQNAVLPVQENDAQVATEALRATTQSAPDPATEEARRADALRKAETQETLDFLNSQLPQEQVPQQAAMTGGAAGDGQYLGYLGGTYGADATRTDFNPVPPQEMADATARAQAQSNFNALPKDEQSTIRVGATMDGLAPDFSYDEVLEWGEENYGITEGRQNSTNESGIDNQIIGANTYQAGKGHVIYSADALDRLGGAGVSVDETRVLLQSLVSNGLTKEQAYEAMTEPDFYKRIKSDNRETGLFGRRSVERLEEMSRKATQWGKVTGNRESMTAAVPDLKTDDQFTTELAPGINPDVSVRDAMIEADRQAFLSKNPGKLYFPGDGGKIPANILNPTGTTARQLATMQSQNQRPLDNRVMPDFGNAVTPQPKALEEVGVAPVLQEGVTTVPDVVLNEPNSEEAAQLPVKTVEEVAPTLPTKEIQVPQSPEMLQVNMPKMNALQAVPAMAALGSAAIQRRALNAMQGPQRPNETEIPQFAYESNIQSQLDNIRNATGTAARGTNLPGQAAAANQQALMAARFRAEGQARALDNRDRQQAKARYDALAYQGRTAQNALRDSYQNDMTAFNNQKAMLDAQIKQQPLNVLASSTQDYLKNVYAPNLAAMIEAQGRQYGTTYNQDQE